MADVLVNYLIYFLSIVLALLCVRTKTTVMTKRVRSLLAIIHIGLVLVYFDKSKPAQMQVK